MLDVGDLRASVYSVGETTFRIRHPSKLSLPQKGHIPPRQNTASSNEVAESLRSLNYEERFKSQKLQSLEKKMVKKRFGPDSLDSIQPN